MKKNTIAVLMKDSHMVRNIMVKKSKIINRG
jgi:hypothetical protein